MNRAVLLTVVGIVLTQVARGQVQDSNVRVVLDGVTSVSQSSADSLEQLIRRSGRPAEVYVGKTLPADIDGFSHERFRAESLPSNGILICVWPDQRKVAMTGGAELEAAGANGAFFRDVVIPSHFKPGWKAGGMVEAVERSLHAVASQSVRQPASDRSTQDPVLFGSSSSSRPSRTPDDGQSAGLLILLFLLGAGGLVVWGIASMDKPRRPGNAGPGMDAGTTHVNTDTTPSPDTSSFSSFDSGSSFDGGGGFGDTGSGSF